MVKGVSKTIIEVNNTGSRFFDKIVFYVTPEYGNLNAKHLKRAAADFAFKYNDSLYEKPLRKIYKRKKTLNFCLFSLGLISLVTVAVVFIL